MTRFLPFTPRRVTVTVVVVLLPLHRATAFCHNLALQLPLHLAHHLALLRPPAALGFLRPPVAAWISSCSVCVRVACVLRLSIKIIFKPCRGFDMRCVCTDEEP